MAVRRSETLCFASREAPDEGSRAARRLRQAGLIRRLGSGRYALTTTGERVRRKIVARLRAAMEAIDAEAVSLPALQGRQPWEQSGRWQAFEGEMFTLRDRDGRDLCLAPTHEEAVVELVRGTVRSYQDLPALVYQVGRKYRDDHARHGLLRTKEFTMKDAYSLHADEASLERTYRAVRTAYLEVFDGLGLDVVVASAGNSVMGGSRSEEFIAPVAREGTLDVTTCRSEDCRFARTDEHPDWDPTRTGGSCPACGGDLERTPGVEVGHIFQLGTRYSEAMDLTVDHPDGRRHVWMGSYGIGVTRVLQTLVQQHATDDGCRFPVTEDGTVAPYRVAILPLHYEGTYATAAEDLHDRLGFEDVLLFDQAGVDLGERFAVSDRLGIPLKLVLGRRYEASGRVEVQTRDGETTAVDPGDIEEVVRQRVG